MLLMQSLELSAASGNKHTQLKCICFWTRAAGGMKWCEWSQDKQVPDGIPGASKLRVDANMDTKVS